MSDPLTNPDRDEDHQRRRDLGEEDDDDTDGLDLAERLYGGLPTDSDKLDPDTDAE
ncbi:hypothetical protein GGP53_003162 [Salinibacter ruber]|uniref:hypothetical protein n=1 Tax=Salinibacter ruber TaxID=146919 RepID=UPI0021693F24|nr:hypothetical protein [Salinibacter ruber]MCS3629282.1 hypothetical protein [Salinibacter ruber]MCS4146190.1 hypothetical protein [Salinibacter ruber]